MPISRLAPPAPFLPSPGASAVEWRVTRGVTAYADAVAEMEARATAIAEGRAAERVWLLEHPPLYTAGTSARDGDLLDARFPVHRTAASSPTTGRGSASPMSCSTSGAVAPTCAPSSALSSAG
jgi:lipoyl(octanoyl) transferase